MIVQPDIHSSEVDGISFNRYDEVVQGIPKKRLRIHISGEVLDDVGNSLGRRVLESNWGDLPQIWRDDLLPYLKKFSKQFNQAYADEDSETFPTPDID